MGLPLRCSKFARISNIATSSDELRSPVRKQGAYWLLRVAVTLVAVSSVLFSAMISVGGDMPKAARLLTTISTIVGAVTFNGLSLQILDIADSALLKLDKPRSIEADVSPGPARDDGPDHSSESRSISRPGEGAVLRKKIRPNRIMAIICRTVSSSERTLILVQRPETAII